MKTVWLKRIAVALVILNSGIAAHAQYVWLDEKGRKQYSDMAPPANIPKSRILQEPGTAVRSVSQTTSAASTEKDENSVNSGSPSVKAKAPMTIAEQNAEFQKRRIEQADKEKKAAEKTKSDADKAKNCDRARVYNRSIESGERLARTDQSGERYFLSDDQRAQESRDVRRILEDCK
jgi:hypothetical protein